MSKIVGYGTAGVAPKDLFIAPKVGIEQLLAKTGKTVADIDLFEVNEAFAAQVLADTKPLGIPAEKLNVCGGGVALGHPIGASGARVLVTLIHQLHRTGGKRGICSLCLGGGNAVSMMVET
jgi:acetyl-CoA C-acetyltransferase